jgi:lysophospholipase L1-like esterase
MTRMRLVVLGACVFLGGCATNSHKAEIIAPPFVSPTVAQLNPALPTIFIAGDSTAAKGPSVDQQGWAEPFVTYFDIAKINIANRARGGRSSRTFITEGLWDQLIAQVKAGDTVIIQFGHNDSGGLNEEPPGSKLPLRARGSIQSLGEETEAIDNVVTKKHEVVHTFGWYIRKMIADVRSKGARPIVMSLTVRNEWTDGKVERHVGRYREWGREIARVANVEFVDLTGIIAARYEKRGQASVADFFPIDSTHTNPAGADFNASCVVAGLKKLKPSFTQYFSKRGHDVKRVRATRG